MSCSMLISVTSFRHYCVILVRSLFSPSGLSRISWHQLNRLKSKLRIYETSNCIHCHLNLFSTLADVADGLYTELFLIPCVDGFRTWGGSFESCRDAQTHLGICHFFDSGHHHQSNTKLTNMFLLKKWPHRLLLLPKFKIDSGSGRKMRNPAVAASAGKVEFTAFPGYRVRMEIQRAIRKSSSSICRTMSLALMISVERYPRSRFFNFLIITCVRLNLNYIQWPGTIQENFSLLFEQQDHVCNRRWTRNSTLWRNAHCQENNNCSFTH